MKMDTVQFHSNCVNRCKISESFKELKYHLTAITRQDNMGYNEKKNREAR